MNQPMTPQEVDDSQTGNPVKVYTKANVSMVTVSTLDSFGQKESRVITGKPKTEESAVKLWNAKELVFFERQNRPLIMSGDILEWKGYQEKVEAPGVEASSDEELTVALRSKFLTLKNLLSKTESVPFLRRLLTLAREIEVSEKYTQAIENKIADLELTSE